MYQTIWVLALAFWMFWFPQLVVRVPGPGGAVPGAGVTPITIQATCTGTGSNYSVPCSGAMTVTAGDAIYCSGSGNNFDPVLMAFSDAANGTYDIIEQLVHPNSANASMITAVFPNSAGGSITPVLTNWESITLNFGCWAIKGARTSLIVDGGSVNQTKSQGTTATNPTSGTAAAPTNDNEIVLGAMIRDNTATVTAGTGWTKFPSGTGTITAIGSSYPAYLQSIIQTTATAENSPMTAATRKYTDDQHAILNASNPAGYRAFSGIFGVPAIAKSNGASVSAADLNGATTTLTTLPVGSGGGWTLGGTAAVYSTAINPTGTGKILLQGIPHTFGDAGTSITFSSALQSTQYIWDGEGGNHGEPIYLASFFRLGSASLSTGFCDSLTDGGGVTDGTLVLQVGYDGTHIYFDIESSAAGTSDHFYPSPALSTDTDYRLVMHSAGPNERYSHLYIQRVSGGVWSTTDTFNYPVACVSLSAVDNCDDTYLQTNAVASGTGSASSGSFALTITGVTGTPVVGDVVTGTGIPWLTTATAVVGGAITLSQYTSGSVSGTVYFNSPMTNLVTATSGTASAGSTALTVVAPTYGTIAQGDIVGGNGIALGTIVAAVTGTAVTLSRPTAAALSTGNGVSFWNSTSGLEFAFGKYSSCSTQISAETFSGITYDPFDDWGLYVPN